MASEHGVRPWCGVGVEIYEPTIILRPGQIELDDYCRVDSFVKIEGGLGVTVGRYVHIASFCHVNIGGGLVEIGDYAALASGAKIIAGSNRPSGLSMSAASPQERQVVNRSRVYIARYAFLGAGAIVLPGVTLNEGAVLGAGAVATRDIPEWEIWAGVPARKIGERAVNA